MHRTWRTTQLLLVAVMVGLFVTSYVIRDDKHLYYMAFGGACLCCYLAGQARGLAATFQEHELRLRKLERQTRDVTEDQSADLHANLGLQTHQGRP